MSYDDDNVLFLALQNDELDRFLVGEPLYFFETKDDNDEPQNVPIVIKLLILPYWREVRDPSFPTQFIKALIKLLRTYPDQNRAIYMAQWWVFCYQSALTRKASDPGGGYADLFDVDMGLVSAELKSRLQANKEALIADTRWAGVEWNSDNGLWGPMLQMAFKLRDELNGPDHVPTNA